MCPAYNRHTIERDGYTLWIFCCYIWAFKSFPDLRAGSENFSHLVTLVVNKKQTPVESNGDNSYKLQLQVSECRPWTFCFQASPGIRAPAGFSVSGFSGRLPGLDFGRVGASGRFFDLVISGHAADLGVNVMIFFSPKKMDKHNIYILLLYADHNIIGLKRKKIITVTPKFDNTWLFTSGYVVWLILKDCTYVVTCFLGPMLQNVFQCQLREQVNM
jgi:hypothetical protein